MEGIRTTPANTLEAIDISRDELIRLWTEFWHPGFGFEVAIDGGLNHGEHKLNGRLDVKISLDSHNRDEVLVVLDCMSSVPSTGKTTMKDKNLSYPCGLFFVEAVQVLESRA